MSIGQIGWASVLGLVAAMTVAIVRAEDPVFSGRSLLEFPRSTVEESRTGRGRESFSAKLPAIWHDSGPKTTPDPVDVADRGPRGAKGGVWPSCRSLRPERRCCRPGRRSI
jgi:hypothetical protein